MKTVLWHKARGMKYKLLQVKDPQGAIYFISASVGDQGGYAKGKAWRAKGLSHKFTPNQLICDKMHKESNYGRLNWV